MIGARVSRPLPSGGDRSRGIPRRREALARPEAAAGAEPRLEQRGTDVFAGTCPRHRALRPARHHPLPNMLRPHACPRSRLRPRRPSPASCTAPALRLRLLLPASSSCSPDRAPLRRRVHPRAPASRPCCPSRAHGRALRHARASPCAQDSAKFSRPRAHRCAAPARSPLRCSPHRAAPYSPSRPNSHFKPSSARAAPSCPHVRGAR